MPPLEPGTLYPNQVEAVTNLEQSLRRNRPRALIQMATGSGKTKAAITAIYRLIKFGGARRVLFMVDRTDLGEQAERSSRPTAPPASTASSPSCTTSSGWRRTASWSRAGPTFYLVPRS
jgi:type I restriction enzyme R subunit